MTLLDDDLTENPLVKWLLDASLFLAPFRGAECGGCASARNELKAKATRDCEEDRKMHMHCIKGYLRPRKSVSEQVITQ